MQKKVIALAVAGLVSGAAFAQSNVTIYGIVDAAYVNSTGDRAGTARKNANFSGINSGVMAGSRIGFKGEEALGNGLKAVFTLEYALANDVNSTLGSAGALQSRQTWVGLSSAKLGTVALGRQYAPGFYAQAKNDALMASAVASPLAVLNAAAGNTIIAASAARWNNSVTYTSPTWSGLTARGIYAFGESGRSTADGISQGDNGMFGAGLNYANGPLNLDAVYQSRLSVATASGQIPATQDSVNEWLLGGSYDFKIAKVFATYQDQNDNNGTSANEGGNDTWSVGVQVPVFGNGKVVASYADMDWDRNNAGGSKAYAVGYVHTLSKRTSLYTTYTVVDNDRNALVAAGGVANTSAIGEKNNTFAAGITHSF